MARLIFIFVVRLVAEVVYEPESPPSPAMSSKAWSKTPAGGAAAPVEEAMPDWGTVLPTADVARRQDRLGEMRAVPRHFQRQTNKIGPPLFGVVGRARATDRRLRLFQRHEGQGRHLDL